MFSTQPSGDEPLHYRPAKDLDAFNSLLPPPIEFVEGSSSGTLAVAEGKYEPINLSPKVCNVEVRAPPTEDRVLRLTQRVAARRNHLDPHFTHTSALQTSSLPFAIYCQEGRAISTLGAYRLNMASDL